MDIPCLSGYRRKERLGRKRTALSVCILLLLSGCQPRVILNHPTETESQNGQALLDAIQQQDFSLAGQLVDQGAKVDCFDNAHKTPLLWASYYGQLDLVKKLLAHGADINARDLLGQNAVMLAQKGGYQEVAAFLLKAGAQPLPSASGSRNFVVATIPFSQPVLASRLRFSTSEINGVPALNVSDEGKLLAKPVTFSSLLTNPAVWDHDQLNNIVYQLGRGYYNKDAYEFCGLINARGKTYLGVRWYSPAASGQNLAAGIVLQLQARGHKLDLILLRKMEYWDANAELYRGSSTPVLKRSPTGDLLLVDWDGTWKLLSNGEWEKAERHE
ncbi:MAG TPA: ankyrin repeat domain-containing protein [Chthonomonadaceae bacterium]|nr:ankyrin repeat domain-containing protein [Chthonomonadaceae bacterium]